MFVDFGLQHGRRSIQNAGTPSEHRHQCNQGGHAGNIYVAGFQRTLDTPDSYDAYVTKLSPDGARILYSTRFTGSKPDYAVALDIDSTGAVYIKSFRMGLT
jgi:hypothetical protein